MVGEEENRSLFFLSRARKERKEKENNVCVQVTFCGGRKQALTKFSFFFLNLDMVGRLSPPQRLLLGIPKKIAKIEKNRKRAGDDGKREKKRKSLSDQDIFSSWLSL